MSSKPSILNLQKASTPISVSLERVPSVIYIAVDTSLVAGADLRNDDFRVEIEGLHIKEGALYKDQASEESEQGRIDYSSMSSAINKPVLVAYFY